jgi:hypothetical protein
MSSSSNPPIPSIHNPPPSTITVDSYDAISQMIVASTSDLDSSTTNVESDAIVGGGDTQYSRKQLRLVNTLHDIG